MAKNKDPAFLFYSADFLVGTIDLTMEERGQYITLICLQHQKGHLPDKVIASIGANISPDVLAKFDVDDEGKYYNTRVEAEIERRSAYVKTRVANGSKGGRPKNHMDNHMDNHMGNHSENENINENINSNSIGIDRGTNLEEAPQITSKEARFNRFWEAYPKKRAKEDARKRWEKLNPSEDLLLTMLSAIDRQKKSPEWLKENGQFIPYPSTWLNRGQWQDEADEPVKEVPKYSSFSAGDAFTRAVERSYAEE